MTDVYGEWAARLGEPAPPFDVIGGFAFAKTTSAPLAHGPPWNAQAALIDRVR